MAFDEQTGRDEGPQPSGPHDEPAPAAREAIGGEASEANGSPQPPEAAGSEGSPKPHEDTSADPAREETNGSSAEPASPCANGEAGAKATSKGRGGKKPVVGVKPSLAAMTLSLALILPPSKDRRHENKEAFERLVASIAQLGILEPLLVRQVKGGKYVILAGTRRYGAAAQLGLPEVPVHVVGGPSHKGQDALITLAENAAREDPTPLRQAQDFQAVLYATGWTQEVVAEKYGVSPGTVSDYLKLLRRWEELTPEEQTGLETGDLSAKSVIRSLGQRAAGKGPEPGSPQGSDVSAMAPRANGKHAAGETPPKKPPHDYREFSRADDTTKLHFEVSGNKKKPPPRSHLIVALQRWLRALEVEEENDRRQ